jgi:BMFP domain-containing protein YqiC
MEKMTETAAIRIKISAKKAEMEDDYLELGKLAFTSVTSGEEVDAQADAITAKVAKIDTLQKEIAALEAKIGKNDEENED